MPTTTSPSIAATIQRLRKAGCVRINDLNTFNTTLPAGEEDGRVPSANQVPGHWRGRYGTDNGWTFICLVSGDLLVLHGEPNSETQKLLEEVCLQGDKLRVSYLNGENLYCTEVLARVRDPFCVFPFMGE